MTYFTYLDSPVGQLLLFGDSDVLRGLYFTVYKHVPKVQADWVEDRSVFEPVISQLYEYFSGKRQTFDLPFEQQGTDFQKSVWTQLAHIPYSERSSYKAIAQAIGKPKAVRAVGTAVGSNPICIISPCHRVLTSSGQIGGYAGGAKNKQFLLQLEAN